MPNVPLVNAAQAFNADANSRLYANVKSGENLDNGAQFQFQVSYHVKVVLFLRKKLIVAL